jgi:TetR/AcrR family tetracycline transcriptional repressor
MKIDRDAIIEAAFAILADKGLEGLSLRLVAERLDVQTPALYWHVQNKAELFGLMAAAISAEAARAIPVGTGWAERLIANARGLRQALLRYRDAARLCVVATPVDDPDVVAERLAVPLIEAGLDRRRALAYQASVIAYTLGWVVYEQSQAMHELLAHMIDFDESFEGGLTAMVSGFAAVTPEKQTIT